MPLVGAFLADAYLGRYRSVIVACTLYVLVINLGSCCLPACPLFFVLFLLYSYTTAPNPIKQQPTLSACLVSLFFFFFFFRDGR